MGMAKTDASSIISRAFRLVVLNLPVVMTSVADGLLSEIRKRIEVLLAHQVRVVLMAPAGTDPETLPVCRDIRGPEKVFLFVLKAGKELIGYDQWCNIIRLAPAAGQRGAVGRRSKGCGPVLDAGAILEYVAEPAGIPLSDVLVIGEVMPHNGFAWGPVLGRFAGARQVALGDARGLPPGVRRVPPGPESVIALLDSLLWTLG